MKTQEELAEFVDKHDTAPHWDDMTPVEAQSFHVTRQHRTAVRVPMSRTALTKVKSVAKQRGVPVDDLLRDWLTQRLKQEQA
jgi:predicted DNA binding CopG/RHH family protein